MRMRSGMAVIAAMVMTAVLSLGSSLAATSVGISDGAAAVTVDQTVVGFAGHEWWVIGDANGGVYSKDKSVTLLAKDYDFGDTAFDSNGIDNRYKGSTLQRKMESIANNFSAKEKGKINDRTIKNSDDKNYPIAGDDVANQKLWALSGDEYLSIRRTNVHSYGSDNWLRSYSPDNYYNAFFAPAAGGSLIFINRVHDHMAARPALNLNLTSVIFTSDASAASKSSATAGGGLVSATAPDTTSDGNKIKYTFRDDENLKLGNATVNKIEANKVTVTYDGATAGKVLSVIARDKGGLVKFYGKLSASTTASGEGSFVVPDNFDFSKYDFEIFVEEIGGAKKSDFASTPKALDLSNLKQVTVINGSGSAKYAEGTEVTLTADTAPQGKRFVRWNISPAVTLTQGSLTNETVKFTMPDEDVTATAVYEDVYTVSVTGGTGAGYYAEGEEVTLTADAPAQGKYFWGWSITPQVTLTEGTLSSGIIKLKMPGENVTATAVYEDIPPVVYPIKDGGGSTWRQGSDGGLIVTSDGEHRKFTGVSVNGAVLDSEHYTAVSGSTVVTLKASYLSTLSVGEHVLRIHFTDGYTETKFSIQEEQTDNSNPPVNPDEPTTPVNPPVVQGGTTSAPTVAPVGTSPKTSDSSRIWIMVSVMLGTGSGFMVINVMKKSKHNN